jgi:hypothetical protein
MRCTEATSAGVGNQIGTGADPDHHGRDEITRSRRIVVEQAEHIALAQPNAEFFVQLTQRGLRLRLAGVAAPARQRPLGGVRTQGRGAAGQQKRRATACLGFRQRDGYRRAFKPGLRVTRRRPRECRAELCDIPPGGIVK